MFDLVRHLFTPHHSNNHRAKVLQTDFLIVYALLFTMFHFSIRIAHRYYPDILGYATNIHMEELLAETNRQRAEAGLSPLTINASLSSAAYAKAQDMFSKNYWAHVSNDGTTPWDFIVHAGYKYTLAGENLAKNFQDSTGVVQAWMASPTHKDNILKPGYKEIGFAIVNGTLNGEETTLVVQMFGARAGVLASAPENETAPLQASETIASEPVSQASTETEQEEQSPVALLPPDDQSIHVLAQRPFAMENNEGLPSSILAAYRQPFLDIPTLIRDVTLVFAGALMGLFILDAWIVARKKVVRASGHTLGHMAFFLSLMIGLGNILPGSII